MLNVIQPDRHEYQDMISFDDDGKIVDTWACAVNDIAKALSLQTVKLNKCPAPEGKCPRGFTLTFECQRKQRVIGELLASLSTKCSIWREIAEYCTVFIRDTQIPVYYLRIWL